MGKYDKKTKQKTAAKKAQPKKSNKGAIAAIIICLVIILLAVAGGGWYYFCYTGDDGLILPNVYAAGIDLGGKTPEEAKNILHLSTDKTYPVEDMVITIPNETIRLTPADTKAKLNVDALVDAAYAHGRSGSAAQQRQARRDALTTKVDLDLLPCMTLDTAFIQSVMDQLDQKYNTALTQPTVAVSGVRPPLEPDQVDLDAPKQTITVTMGIPESALDTMELYAEVLNAYAANRFEVNMDFAIIQPEKPDLDAMFRDFCVEPVDAVLETENYTVSEEVYGYGFDRDLAQQKIDEAGNGETLEIQLDYIAPQITKASIEATLFQDELGSCDAWQGSGNNRLTNLRLACEAINGMLVRPGETFSYNKALGERTEEKGYKPATAYIGGESVDSLGGGICQVSTALYYAALHADLEIVERAAHMYPSSYVPLGMDATVAWGYLDFKFKNNTDYPIRIEAVADGRGTTAVKLIGTETKDYYVEMEYVVLKTYDWEEVIEEIPAEDNPKGYKDGEEISAAHTGYDVATYKYKYDKETDKLISKDYEASSSYTKTDKVIAKIIYPTEPTEPPTEPTEAPEGFGGVAGEG